MICRICGKEGFKTYKKTIKLSSGYSLTQKKAVKTKCIFCKSVFVNNYDWHKAKKNGYTKGNILKKKFHKGFKKNKLNFNINTIKKKEPENSILKSSVKNVSALLIFALGIIAILTFWVILASNWIAAIVYAFILYFIYVYFLGEDN